MLELGLGFHSANLQGEFLFPFNLCLFIEFQMEYRR